MGRKMITVKCIILTGTRVVVLLLVISCEGVYLLRSYTKHKFPNKGISIGDSTETPMKMRNALATHLAANAFLFLLFQAAALPASPLQGVGGLRQGANPALISVTRALSSKLAKSPSQCTALKLEMSVDKALDRAATFRQYFLVGFKWTAEFLAIMAGVFSMQTNFESKHESIIGSFDIQRPRVVVGVCNSCFFAGQAAGTLMAGSVGDLLGRKAAVIASSGMISFFALLTAFAGSPVAFAILRLFTGVGLGLGSSNAYVLASEFVGSKYNGMAGVGMAAFGSLGMMLIAPIAFQLQNWRLLMLLVALVNIYPVVLHASILESPRWLLAKGRKDEARATILKAIASVRHLDPQDEAIHLSMATPSRAVPSRKAKGIMEGLKHHQFRSRLLVMAGCWFVGGLVFFGLACNVGKVPGNAHMNQALFAMADLASIPIQLLLVAHFGRRSSIVIVAGITALGLLSSAIPDAFPALAMLPAKAKLLAAKVAVTTYFALVYVISSELFPTSVRSTAVALCSLSARIATILAPLLISALDVAPAASSSSSLARSAAPLSLLSASSSSRRGKLSSFSSFSPVSWMQGMRIGAGGSISGDVLLHAIFAAAMLASAAAAVLFLPETKGLGLPESLEDLCKAK